METKDTLSLCSDSDEQDMQQMLQRTKIMKDKHRCTRKKLTKDTIIESKYQNAFRVLKTQFEKFFTSVLIKPSSLDGTYARKDFHAYTGMEPQFIKVTILKNFDFIEIYMLKTIIHAETIQKRLDEKKLQIQESTVQEVKASDAISEDKAQERCMVSYRLLHSHLKLLSNNDLKGTRTEYGFKRAFTTLFGQDLETFISTIFLNMDQLEKQLDNEEFQEIGSMDSFKVLKIQFQMFIKSQIYLDDEYVVMTPYYFLQYTQLEILKFRVVRQPTAFKYERPRISKPRFASQVNVNNDLPKPVTTHYFPMEREYAFAKPHHMTTPSSTRYSLNDMVHNHYLEEAKKKTQEIDRNSKPSKCLFSANHDSCVTKFLKEVNSRAKVPSNKTTNRNKLVEQTSFVKKPKRQIPKGHRFSIKKAFVVHEKTMTPRSCLKWKSTGKIFKTIGLRWVPTRKIFTFSTTKVDSEPSNGSNADISNPYECEQTLNVNTGFKKFKYDKQAMTSDHNSLELGIQDHNNKPSSSKLDPKVVPPADKTSQQELELLFSPMYKEYFNAGNQSASKSFILSLASQEARLSKFKADFKQQQSEMTNKIAKVLKAITDRIVGALPSSTTSNAQPKFMVRSTPSQSIKVTPRMKRRTRGYTTTGAEKPTTIDKIRSSRNDEEIKWLDVEEPLDLVDTGEESVYESLIMKMPKCSLNYDFRIKKGDPRNLKIPCMIGHKFTANAYIDVDLPMNIMSLAYYNSSRKNEYEYRGRNFIGLGRDIYVFVGNMSYIMDFTILENIKANIDPSLSYVVFGQPFIEIACLAINRKHGLMTFMDGIKEATFKIPYKDPERSDLSSEGHDLLSSRIILSEDDYDKGCRKPSDLEHGFYKDITKLGPEYLNGMDDKGEVTMFESFCNHALFVCNFFLSTIKVLIKIGLDLVKTVLGTMFLLELGLLTPYTRLRDKDLQKSKDLQVVVAIAKIPILNPNEFDLWKMRIKQYFLMTDYSLWEIILNGDYPILTTVVDGVVQPIAPTTVEQRLAKKNELKTRGTLLMALLDNHQLKFNIHKDAKSLMEAIEKRLQKLISQLEFMGESLSQEDINMKFLRSLPLEWRTHTLIWRNKTDLEDQSLDDLFNNLKIYAAERKGRNLEANGTTSIGFHMSKVECYNCHRRGHFARKCRSPKDTRNKDTQRRNVPVETSTSNALVSQYDGVGSYDWSFQEDEEPTNYALMAFTSSSSTSSSGSDSKKSSLESVKARLLVYQQNENVFEEDIKLLKLNVMLRDNALVEHRKKFEEAEKERDDLKNTLEKFQTSSKNLSKLLASQITDKSGLRYDNQVFKSTVFDCDDLNSYELDISVPTSPVYDRYKLGKGYHAVPLPYIGTFMPPKPDLVFHDAPTISETVFNVEPKDESEGEPMPTQTTPSFVQTFERVKTPRTSVKSVEHPTPVSNHRKDIPKSRVPRHSWNRKACFVCKSVNHLIKVCDYYENKMVQKHVWNHAVRVNQHNSARMTHPHSKKHILPIAVLTRSRLVPFNVARPVTFVVPQTNVKHQRPTNHVVNKSHSPIRRTINHRPSPKNSNFHHKVTTVKATQDNSQHTLKNKGVINSSFSRYINGNISYLFDFKELNRGYVAFGGNPKGGKITGKGKIKTGTIDFDDVYFVKELKFNLFSFSQMCDEKNSVLFTDTKCVVLYSNFKLPDENHVLLRVPRENNMYNVDVTNIIPSRDLTCIFAKATLDEPDIWHRRLGHINFKTMNKLVKGNLVRGLPSKVFENNHACVAYKKDKQHRASCKSKPISYVSQPLQRLHMDLFGPTFVKSLNKKSYCLVVTDDYSRFSWVFVLATKDETSLILKTFIISIENQINHKVKIIRSDNETEFKNHDLNQFYRVKGIKREFSVAGTPQQNRVAERKNRTLIEAARTMLADSLLPIPFWAEAVNTACYVQNRVLVTKPHNKTPYELLLGKTPSIGFMRPFGCPVTILNTLDPIGMFDRKADKGFLVGYSISSKAFRVFNKSGPTWLFDIDTLTQSMNYQPVVVGNQLDHSAGIQENLDAGKVGKEPVSNQQYVLLPLWSTSSKDHKNIDTDATYDDKETESKVHVSPRVRNLNDEFEEFSVNSTNRVYAASTPVTIVGQNSTNSINSFNVASPSNTAVSPTFEIGGKFSFVDPSQYPDDPNMPTLEDITYSDDEEDVGAEADFSNLETNIIVRPILTTRVHKDHPVTQIIGDLSSAPQKRSMAWMVKEQGFEDPDYPDKVYKVVKALYGLHQALRAWYETLANYLSENGFQRGKIDQTLFIKKQKGDILLVQVYVDDIIFGSTNKDLCKAFEKLMKDKFQMSLMGELTFFLGLQDSPFNLVAYSDSDYVGASLNRKSTTGGCQFLGCRLISWQCKKQTVVATSSNEAKYVATKSHLSLWYPKDSPFNLVAYSDSDYVGASLNRKSTTGGQTATDKENSNPFMADSLPKTILLTFIHGICLNTSPLEFSLVYLVITSVQIINAVSSKLMLFGLTIDAAHLMLLGHKKTNDVMRLQALIDTKKVIITEYSIRQVLRLDDADGVDCLPNKEIFIELARMGYEKPSIKLTFYKAFFSAQWIKGFSGVDTPLFDGMLVQQQAQDVEDATEDKNDDNETCATLTKKVANLEQDKVAQAIEITKLKQRVRRRIRGVIIQDPKEAATASVIMHLEANSKGKGKGILVEKPKSLKRQAQIKQDEAFAKELEAELNANINWNDVVDQLKRKERQDNIVMRYQALKRKPVTEAQARKNMMVYLKNMVGFKMYFFRRMTYNDIRPIFEKHYNLNQAFLERVKEEVICQEEGSKRKDDSLEQRADKKQKIDEETEELKTHLQIIPNDDDVYIEATPLASKVHVVDYQIHHKNNKPYYKIIRADGTHQMILLVEKKYPLTRFTLEQMLNNIRVEVEEESEMSLELLRDPAKASGRGQLKEDLESSTWRQRHDFKATPSRSFLGDEP
uniref:Uncharacterized protein n=1 Tax=Tanacetum cinerariifolium TaxID=118510 RepID=A0A6L2L591_TANCI|nr:hypothetical protein [Tanacetum cinerariifolium]